MPEYVYLIGSEESPFVKIGRSTDVQKRLAAIQRMSPVKLSVLWQAKGGADVETALHRQFKTQRSHGEWFEFPDHDAPEQVARALAKTMRKTREGRAGFFVGDVVLITREGWPYCPTGVIRGISSNGDHPFIVQENDGQEHWWLPMFGLNEIARQYTVREMPFDSRCDRTGCWCEGVELTPDEHSYYYGSRPQ